MNPEALAEWCEANGGHFYRVGGDADGGECAFEDGSIQYAEDASNPNRPEKVVVRAPIDTTIEHDDGGFVETFEKGDKVHFGFHESPVKTASSTPGLAVTFEDDEVRVNGRRVASVDDGLRVDASSKDIARTVQPSFDDGY